MHLGGKKRGFLVVFAIFLYLISIVYAGYCGNAESYYYCDGDPDVDIDDCCPSDGYYGDTGLPSDQSDCQTYYFNENTLPDECSISGYCYRSEESLCYDALQGECLWWDYGEIWAENFEDIAECEEVCCEYNDGLSDVIDWTSTGFCDVAGGDINTSATTEEECSALEGEAEAAAECEDEVDNDGDGYTDYPNDPGCESGDDASELESTYICDDGVDNDGDGDIDAAEDDGCCEDPTTSSEQLCGNELPSCDNEEEIVTECVCGDPYAGGTVCDPGNYCCDDLCQTMECGAECSTGQLEFCYAVDDELYYRECVGGAWEDCELYGVAEPEVCTDNADNDGDGEIDCEDIDCYQVDCEGSDYCTEYEGGTAFRYGNNYVCCSSDDTHDCDGDGTVETCGACDCTTNPVEAEIEEITFTQGEPYLSVVWDIACNVEFSLLRCEGDDCITDIEDLINEEIRAAFPEYRISGTTDFSYDDYVGPNQRYCYVVESFFSGANEYTFSEPVCIEDSGDEICQQVDDTSFCTAAGPSLSGELTQRSYCDEENQHQIYEYCDSDEYCIGPNSEGLTECIYQSDCETCGDPLGLYGFLFGDSLVFNEDEEDCYELDTCFWDYTETSVDWYHSCVEISSCYDYISEAACTGQSDANGYSTNKCLWRECEWVDNQDTTMLVEGWCIEQDESFTECSYCNDAEHNLVFGACTTEKCLDFGYEDNLCYLSSLTGECEDADMFSCSDYGTEEDCVAASGGDAQPVVIDVTYEDETRTAGTHEITTPSDDYLGIELCMWYNDGDEYVCAKDADGDEEPDSIEDDLTPPTTTIITDDKVADLNITFLAKDLEEDGSAGSGVLATYYCVAEPNEDPCYPDTMVELDENGLGYAEDGEGGGEHTVYYYSEDQANNLEIVQSTAVEVDRSAPVITITYSVNLDGSEPYEESTITFDVSVDENAFCTDEFEATEINQIDDDYNNHFVVKYEDLTDGYYRYKVTCTDDLGNEGDASIVVRVEADTAVFDPLPSGIIDYDEVELSVKTLEDANCGFSAFTEESSFSAVDQSFSKSDEGDHYLFTWDYSLEENMEYWFDVKCELLDQGRESDDEIQFVYDDTTPVTVVVDAYGNEFDFGEFYNGEDLDVYLECTDEPEYGFGCEKTLYCIDESATCTPDTENDPLQPLDFDFNTSDRYDLCYRSYENTISGYGGLVEDTECMELKIDNSDPELEIYSPEDESTVYIDYVEVTGEVEDPDATAGTPNNIVTIELTNTEGEVYTFTDIEANNEFSYEVTNLTLESNSSEFNLLNIYATDRSGATTDVETIQVRYTEELPEPAITLVSPENGYTSEETFDLTVETYLDSEECGYSRNDASLDSSVAMDQINDYTFSREITIAQPEGVDDYIYVKCRLENGIEYGDVFAIVYDTTPPEILYLYIMNSDGKDPPNIVESPLEAQVVVETDDKTKCKYSEDSTDSYFTGMIKFDNYDDIDYARENNHTFASLSDQTTYTYYIQCANGAGDLTDKYELEFTVDTSLPSEMELVYPGDTYLTEFELELWTTKTSSECKYGLSEDAIDNVMSDLGDSKSFISDVVTADEGLQRYYFTCSFAEEGEVTDYFEFYVDLTPPVVHYVDDGDEVYTTTQLGAIWNASDDMTGIDYYDVSVGTYASYSDVVNWTYVDAETITFTELNLTNQTTYYWNVYAIDKVGWSSELTSSDGVFVDESGSGTDDNGTLIGDVEPDLCANEIQDEDETDVDCGGSDCDPCLAGERCLEDTDCTSNNCENDVCEEATCFDLIMNGYETDVDCGGGVCVECDEGQMCILNNDCYTNYCANHVCAVPSCTDNVQNGFEEGVDCGGNCPTPCTTATSPGTCYDNIKNQGETGIDCGGPCSACREAEPEGIGWGWLLIVLLLMLVLGAGGYVGYIYWYEPKYGSLYDKLYKLFTGKERRPPVKPMMGPPGRPAMGRPMPGKRMPPGKMAPAARLAYQRRMQEIARQKARQEKAKVRKELFGKFEAKKPGKPSEKLPLKPAKGIEGKISAKGKPGVKPTPTKPAVKPAAKAPVKKPKTAFEELEEMAAGKPAKKPAKATPKKATKKPAKSTKLSKGKQEAGKTSAKPAKKPKKAGAFEELEKLSKKKK